MQLEAIGELAWETKLPVSITCEPQDESQQWSVSVGECEGQGSDPETAITVALASVYTAVSPKSAESDDVEAGQNDEPHQSSGADDEARALDWKRTFEDAVDAAVTDALLHRAEALVAAVSAFDRRLGRRVEEFIAASIIEGTTVALKVAQGLDRVQLRQQMTDHEPEEAERAEVVSQVLEAAHLRRYRVQTRWSA